MWFMCIRNVVFSYSIVVGKQGWSLGQGVGKDEGWESLDLYDRDNIRFDDFYQICIWYFRVFLK